MTKKAKETQSASSTAASASGGADKPVGKIKQLRMIARVVHQQSPKSIPIAIAVGLGVLVLAVLGGILTGAGWYWSLLGIPFAFLAGFIVFTRSAQRVQYRILEGQLGGGMAILQNMRGNWSVTPGVNASRNMDVVHRVVGRPGIVLVGEGDPRRLKQLLASEKKRVARVAANADIYELQVGTGEGQVPVSKLQGRMGKLPRNLNKAEVAELNNRLQALTPAAQQQMPKGPLPKGTKLPKGPKPPSG